jgi:hypothetical protein
MKAPTRPGNPPQPPAVKSAEEIARMSPAARLDYVRQFDQKTMPPWQDPRTA